jgi:hypothetical protein
MAMARPLSAAAGSSSSSLLLAGPILHLTVTVTSLVTCDVTAVTFSSDHRIHGFIKNPNNLKNTICFLWFNFDICIVMPLTTAGAAFRAPTGLTAIGRASESSCEKQG